MIIFLGELGSNIFIEVFCKLEVLGNFDLKFNCESIWEIGEVEVVLEWFINKGFFVFDCIFRGFFVVVIKYLLEVFKLFVWLFLLVVFELNKYFLEFLVFSWGFFVCCMSGENFFSMGKNFIVLLFGVLVVIICFIL